MESLNPEMLILAREIRGYTQKDVAELTGVSFSNISRMENSGIGIQRAYLEALSKAVNLPISFFYQKGGIMPDATSYRKRQTVAQKVLNPIQAKVNIVRMNLQQVLQDVRLDVPKLPVISIDETTSPEDAAKKVRKLWKIDTSVVLSMTALLEDHGVLIASFPFNTDRVDSRTILTAAGHPIICYNKSLLGDRQRWTLAYELGHLVMHVFTKAVSGQDICHEANLFAAEFLMPEKEILKDFTEQITLPLLAELKCKWGVSMISLLYRADNLGYLTANQKKYLLSQFNTSKIRKREPGELDVPVEEPMLVKALLADYRKYRKATIADTAKTLALYPEEFAGLYSLPLQNETIKVR